MHDDIIVVTANGLAGYVIVEVYVEVFGLIVRRRNVFSNFDASLRTIFGGEVRGYTRLSTDSRNQAIARMCDEAAAKGANAVLATRLDFGGCHCSL